MADKLEVGLVFNTTYQGLEEGKQDLKELKKIIDSVDSGNIDLNIKDETLEQAKLKMQALERAIKEAETSGGDFGTIFKQNLNVVQKEAEQTTASIKKTEKSIKNLNQASKGNNGGLSQISTAARLATKEVKGTTGQIDQLRNNLQQGLGQSIAFGAIGAVTGGFLQALSTASQLDEVSTDISIVSSKTREEMEGYRDAAVQASDALGTTTKDYLKASLIYEQQGGQAAYYADELAKSTVIAANVSGMATDEMSEYLTSTINGFQLLKERGGEAGTYITDVMAKLGAASGSDLAEVATGLSRTANTAKDAGLAFEEISSMIATVSEVTRQSPETIGTAFKTILANITSLREAGEEEVEAFTNNVAKALSAGGIDDISLFDNGSLRDAADIIRDISGRWDEMNKVQQSLVSEALAGKRQAEVLRAYLNNQERYTDLLNQAYGSAGTAAQQQLIYMDSLGAKTEQFQNAWQGMVNNITDTDFMKGVLDDATNLLKIVGSTKTEIGGLATVISPLIGVGGQMFGAKKISEGFSNRALNKQAGDIVKEYGKLNKGKDLSNDKTRQEIENAKRLTLVQSSLGDEAKSNLEAQIKESQRLSDILALTPRSLEEAQQKAKELAEEFRKVGSVAGLDNNRINVAVSSGYQDTDIYKDFDNQIKAAKKVRESYDEAAASMENLHDLNTTSPNAKKAKPDKMLKEMEKWSVSYKELLSGMQNPENIMSGSDSFAKIEKEIVNFKGSAEGLLKLRERAAKLEDAIRDEYLKQNGASDEANEKAKALLKTERERRAEISEQSKTQVAGEYIEKNLKDNMDSSKDTQTQLDLNDNAIKKTETIAKKTRMVEEAVGAASLAYSTIVPTIATFNAVQEEQISVQDGVIATTQNVSAMLMASMNPVAMAIGAVTGVLGFLVDKFDLFKSKAEKAKEINDSLVKSFMSLQESASQSISTLSDIEEVYSRFQGADAASILKEGDTEKMEAYTSMASKLVEIYPELLKYYDEHGQAIVDLSSDYDELLAKKAEEQRQNSEILSNNSGSFFIEYSANIEKAMSDQTRYQEMLIRGKAELEVARESNDDKAISKSLKDISSYSEKLAAAQTVMKETKDSVQSNIVQPFIDATGTLGSLSTEAQNLLKGFLSESFNQESAWASISTDNSENLETTKTNLKLIADEFERLETEKEGSGQGVLDFFNKLPEFTQQMMLLNDEAKNFADLQTAADSVGATGYKAVSDTYTKAEEAKKNINEVGVSNLSDKSQDIASYIEDAIDLEKTLANYREVIAQEQSELEPGTTTTLEIEQLKSGAEAYEKDIEKVNKKIEEFNNTSAEQSEKIKNSVDAIEKQNTALENVRNGYEGAIQSAEGLKEAQENLSNAGEVYDLLDGMSKSQNPLSPEQFQSNIDEIKSKFPEIGEAMQKAFEDGGSSAEAQTDAIKKALGSTQQYASNMIQGMMGDNEDYFAKWKESNKEQVTKIEEDFGIDASKVTTLNELRREALKSNLTNEATFTDEKGKLSKESTDTEKKNQEIANDNHAMSLASQLQAEGLNEELKVAITEATEKAKYKIRRNLWDNIMALIDGDKQAKKEQEEYDKEYNKVLKKKMETILENNEKYKELEKQFKDETNYKNAVLNTHLDSADWNRLDVKDLLDKMGLGKTGDDTDDTDDDTDDDDEITDETESEVANLELELDRYYKLEDILKTIEKRYGELSDAKDAAYGNDKLAIMNQEKNLLAEKTGVLREYISALRQEQEENKKVLAGNGFTFTANGDIANLNEKLKAMQDNANSLSGEAKEAAIDAVNNMKEVADRYQDITFNLIPDKEETLNEIKRTLSELEKEKIEYKIQLVTDAKELKDTVLEAVKEFQDSFSDLDEKARIVGKEMQSALDSVSYWEGMIKEVRKNRNLTDNDRQEMMKEYNKNLLAAVSDARASYEELESIQNEYVNQSVESINKLTERYQDIIGKASTLADKTLEIYGTGAADKVAEYYGVQEDAINSQIANLQQVQKELIKYRDTLEEGTEAWKAANDAVNEMGNSISEAILSKLDILQQKFDLFTQSLAGSFNKMFGIYGLAGATEDFEDLLDSQDKYFSNMDKFATIGSKIKSINEEIAKTNDPERAKELAEYRDRELATLLEQEKVTQDDYDRAEKLYEIKLKELALQDRQNAQRMAQLVRDSNGNMTYEYVRTETADSSKEREELENAQNGLYDFDSEKAKEAAKGVFDIIADYQSKIAELKDGGLDSEAYEEELKKLLDEAQSDIQGKTDKMNKWIENAAKDSMNSLETMINNGTITADQLGVDKNMLSSIFSGLSDGTVSIQDIMSGNYDDFANSLGMTTEELSGTMDQILELILGDNLEMAEAMQDASDKWTSTAKDNVESLGDAYADYMSEADQILNNYTSSTGNLNEKLNETDEAAKKVINTINEQTQAMINTRQQTDRTAGSVQNLQNKLIGVNGVSGLYGSMMQLQKNMNENLQPSYINTGIQTDILTGKTYDSATKFNMLSDKAYSAYQQINSYSDQPTKTAMGNIDTIGGKTRVTADAFDKTSNDAKQAKNSVRDFSNEIGKLQGYGSYKLTGAGARTRSFASGGYTGQWTGSTNNAEGRLAVLHEKELVLNSEDTSNILSAVKMQRKLLESIKGRGSNTKNTVRNMNSNISNIQNNNSRQQTVEQSIALSPTFPNATNRGEIEGALQGLLVKASTYVGKI